ncbi:RNA-directed DNA polymerase, eukaryota, reverse transcriptase zinc-binding domain protein [Tanacetum coccineum]
MSYRALSRFFTSHLKSRLKPTPCSNIVSPEQSAFIAGRQILDGPLMLSECIDWYKKKSKNLMIFKVGFEKAYDSVSWKYLDFILQSLGFGIKWRRWIQVFYLASGLKININKSNVYGVGVSLEEVSVMARMTGCTSSDVPFIYLGLPIGSNMNLICNWKRLVDRFQSKLSSWKSNLISIGGRGGDESNRKLAWVKWDNVLASFDKGGLGVGSLEAFNLALHQKWCWRLINNTNLLWVRLIKSIHGVEAGLDEKGCKTVGLWSRIIGTVNYLHSSGVIPRDCSILIVMEIVLSEIEFIMALGLGIGVDMICEVATMKLWFRYCLTLAT